MSTKNLSYFENARKIVGINVKQVILKMLKIVGVGCEPRIGVILKMQKKLGGGGGGVDVNEDESRGSGGCDFSRAGEWVRWVDLTKELK